MSLQIDTGWISATVLLWLRLAALFLLTPVFAGFKGPAVVMAALSLCLAAMLSAAWPEIGRLTGSLSLLRLFVAGLCEVFVGVVLAFGVHSAFAAIGAAGRIVDLQIGFGAGATFDPITRANAPVLDAALSSLGVVVFFVMDAHHALLRGIAFSVSSVPPGTLPTGLAVDAVVGQFGAVFTLALALIAPVMAMLLLLEGGLAVVSRVLPQMNVFFVSMPVKIIAGLAMLAMAGPQLSSVMGRAYASIFGYWTRVLH